MTLTQYFHNVYGKQVKIAHIGNHQLNDILATNDFNKTLKTFQKWDSLTFTENS
jgi:hypothetical protein